MFLQTPIWIALYAMLYMVFDLRHQSAFYGGFLADLSRGDSLIPLPDAVHFTLPLMGTISAINVLPLLMGVLFFVQQKYMTPPPSAELSPEMKTQQKIMKVMLVVMLPVFMYNAPAALTLYFLTNSTLGILESRYIRSHVNQIESDLEEHGVKTVRELKKRKRVANKARPLSETKRFKDR
jgi:YidC/Oxa1 family membrane protein insertase